MHRVKLTAKQKALYDFLKDNSGKTVEISEILSITAWKRSTWEVYWRKGIYNRYFRTRNGKLLIRDFSRVSELQFYQQATQATSNRSVAARCESPLARALVERARDNFILALELFNRPSLHNRSESFAVLACAAWEQLLKAQLIEERSESEIFTDRTTRYGRRCTISLEKALGPLLKENDPVRMNLERIADLRHGATHLLMPEAQGTLSFLFQACALNFMDHFERFTGRKPISVDSTGLLSLICERRPTSTATLRDRYGRVTGDEIAALLEDLEAVMEQANTEKFAFSVETRVVLTRKPQDSDLILTDAGGGPKAVRVEVPTDIEKTYRFTFQEVVDEIKRRTGDTSFNRYSLSTIIRKEKIVHHPHKHYFRKLARSLYSEELIDLVVGKLLGDPSFLQRARESYRAHLQRKRSRKQAGQRT